MSNAGQEDANHNKVGDACDDGIDTDQDGYPDSVDNCPDTANAEQLDSDKDGTGDGCDTDKELEAKVRDVFTVPGDTMLNEVLTH